MFDLHLPLLTIFFATAVSGLVVLYYLQYVRRYGATMQVVSFTIFAVAVGVWALFAMLQVAATTFESAYLAYKLLHLGAWGTPIPMLFYAFSAGPAARWVTKRTAVGLVLSVLPLFVLLSGASERYLFVEPTLQTIGDVTRTAEPATPVPTESEATATPVDSPGFGPVVAVVAVLLGALATRRRR
ncbi:PGF-CTERM sorting domain-containing protein [Halobellus sp. Atlit-31R]|nr:PGF-CTERM sorting domain-containing protein [Halobellus sp. Atlit-31R]